MSIRSTLLTALTLVILAPATQAVDQIANPALDAQLETASTNLQRAALLPTDSSWKFDFTTHPYYTFSPGGVINANAATFPATISNDLTLAMLNLGPCKSRKSRDYML